VPQLERLLANGWLGAKEAGRLLDRTTQLVWHLGRTGKLRVLQTPAGVLYSREDVERILRERKEKGHG
jgi:hypothetical protein